MKKDFISAQERVSIDFDRTIFERCWRHLTKPPAEAAYYEAICEKRLNAQIINLGLLKGANEQ